MVNINSEVMNICTRDELVYLKFKALQSFDFINHAVSTRHGGVSDMEGLETLNLGSHTADSMDNVRENYRRFCQATGFDAERVVLGNQTHSLNIRYATEADVGKGVFCDRDYTDVDALVTDIRNLPLVIHTADCVPVSFIDTRLRVIGNAHCGWRGTFGMLSSLVIDEMSNRFGTRSEDLVCTIGPCICKDCYEVSEDLFMQFKDKFGDDDALEFNGSYYIDLALLNKHILMQRGVREDKIFVSDLCTCCNSKDLFSHRGQGPKRGILASVIKIV